MNSSLIEYGTSPSGHTVVSCGPHTGHFFVPIAFCRDADTAQLLSAAADMAKALAGLKAILDSAESNASGNPEWEAVSAKINAAREALAKATGQ
jgi:hypothetical protein